MNKRISIVKITTIKAKDLVKDPSTEQETNSKTDNKESHSNESLAKLSIVSIQGQEFILPSGPIEGIPPGLELLVNVSKITIKHQTHFMPSIMSNFESYSISRRYDIFNDADQRIYFAAESSNNAATNCCGAQERPFKIFIVDSTGRVVLELNREDNRALCLISCCFCCPCLFGRIGGSKTKVTLGDGTHFGTIKHSLFRCCCSPSHNAYDSKRKKVLMIKGSDCGDCCIKEGMLGKDTKFTAKIPTSDHVGTIWKSGVVNPGSFLKPTDDISDSCKGEIPVESDVNTKALFLAAIFVLNFMYFDRGMKGVVEDYDEEAALVTDRIVEE